MSQGKWIALPKRKFLTAEERTWYEAIVKHAPTANYCCFTFATPVNSQQADRTFRDVFDKMSLRYRANIGWIRAEEHSLSGCGNFSIRRHYHCILLSSVPIAPESVQEVWTRYVGNSKCELFDLAKGDGIGYMLKMREREHCDWDLSDNLYLFVPGYRPSHSRKRRVMARHLARSKALTMSIETAR